MLSTTVYNKAFSLYVENVKSARVLMNEKEYDRWFHAATEIIKFMANRHHYLTTDEAGNFCFIHRGY